MESILLKLLKTTLLLLFIFNILGANEVEKVDFTKKELDFIIENRDVKIAMTHNFIPFIFMKNNQYQGFNIDILNKISKISGLKFTIQTDSWADSLKSFKEGRVDMISSISHTTKREAFTLYTQPYYEIPTFIFGKKGDTYYQSIDSLKGKKVGIVTNMFYKERLKEAGIEVVEYETNHEKAKALAFGQIDYFLSNFISGNRAIISQSLTNIEPLDEFTDIKREDLRFGINKNTPILHSIIQKSLNKISYKEYEELKNRWIIGFKESNPLNLTKEELAYLKKKKSIKVCFNSNYPPIMMFDNGKYRGVPIDFLELISKKFHLKYEIIESKSWKNYFDMLKNRECDTTAISLTSPNYYDFLTPTKPYVTGDFVLVTKSKEPYIIDDRDRFKDKKIAILKGSKSVITYIKTLYPNITLVEVERYDFEQLTDNRLYGIIGRSLEMSHIISSRYANELKIMSKVGEKKVGGSFGVSSDEPILLNILNRAIDNLSVIDKQQIMHRWYRVKVEKQIDYKLIKHIIVGFFIILSMITLWLVMLRRNNQKIKEFNNHLEEKIKKAVEKNRQQQLLMFQQSRLAQMGEIISMIAHQWRQPLNNINALVILMDMKMSKQDNANKFLLEKEFNKIESTTAYMSNTIDDFRNFFRPQKEKVWFNLKETIEHTIELISPIFLHEKITIKRDHQENIKLLGYPNELGQVIVNIINNAKDALISNNSTKEKNISIQLFKKDKKIVLTIQDNAGGIDPKIINHIFDPYFSTKSKKNGTGLGLYISKMIIEEHMNGEIGVKNSDDGALFRIEFKISNP